MTKNDDVMFTVQVNITREKLAHFLNVINNHVLYLDDVDSDDTEITIEECQTNSRLMAYICSSAVEDGTAVYDPLEFWNNDGWCDVRDYR